MAIELVLDTSGSMRERLGRQRRIDVAKDVLARLVTEQLAPGTPVALRTFRPERRSCETELVVPLGPLDPAAMGATVEALDAVKTVQTPLAAAIAAVAEDLASVEGPRLVVVVSDGRETCGGDPEAAVQGLMDAGFDVSVNVVGLGLDRKSRREVSRLAEIGRGTYYDAQDADGLAKALKRATGAPFVVLDAGRLRGRPRHGGRTPGRAAARDVSRHRRRCAPAPLGSSPSRAASTGDCRQADSRTATSTPLAVTP